MICRKKKAREWQVRLTEEIKTDTTGKFITLSFSDISLIKLERAIRKDAKRNSRLMRRNEANYLTGYNLENEIATIAVRRFCERWRRKFDKSVKHWFVTELGQKNTERIHMHGIIFTKESGEVISERWGYGHITIGNEKYENGVKTRKGKKGYVNERTVNYVVKYVSKLDKLHKNYKSKVLTSPGMGKGYLETEDAKRNKFKPEGGTDQTYITRKGLRLPLPTYYRNKLYTEDEKELLWIESMDKGIKYLNGIKYKMPEDESKYNNMLKKMRQKNITLGYGDNKIDIEKRLWENNRRNVKRLERYAKEKEKEEAYSKEIKGREIKQKAYKEPPTKENSGRKFLPKLRLKNAFKGVAQRR